MKVTMRTGSLLMEAQTLCGIINLPAPPSKYHVHELFLEHNVEKLCKRLMEQVVEEAVTQNENISDSLCVAVDGSWQKRGHGIVAVTLDDSGKVLDTFTSDVKVLSVPQLM